MSSKRLVCQDNALSVAVEPNGVYVILKHLVYFIPYEMRQEAYRAFFNVIFRYHNKHPLKIQQNQKRSEKLEIIYWC